ncbi:MAG: hypothetical protein EBU77_10065, partial [Betaproteobacteria bacterium]|nr:hypothetical protein [Betaproteobacteria bacterium]
TPGVRRRRGSRTESSPPKERAHRRGVAQYTPLRPENGIMPRVPRVSFMKRGTEAYFSRAIAAWFEETPQPE